MKLEDIWRQPASSELHAATLVITQEDGRTAYAPGLGSRMVSTKTLEMTFLAMFSDRINSAASSVPVPTNSFGVGFLQPQVMSNSAIDVMTLSIDQLPVNGSHDTLVRLLRWGATFRIKLAWSPGTRTYQAAGPKIGNAPASALYVVSFQ